MTDQQAAAHVSSNLNKLDNIVDVCKSTVAYCIDHLKTRYELFTFILRVKLN